MFGLSWVALWAAFRGSLVVQLIAIAGIAWGAVKINNAVQRHIGDRAAVERIERADHERVRIADRAVRGGGKRMRDPNAAQ